MIEADPTIIVCQIGAREHYSIAKAAHERDMLAALVTDVWVPPGSAPARIAPALGAQSKNFTERFAAELGDAKVFAPGVTGLFQNYLRSMTRNKGWDGIIAHNAWFGPWAVAALARSGLLDTRPKPVIFAYSYAARDIFKFAKSKGARTVLGQIDPGPEEPRLINDIARSHGLKVSDSDAPPPSYWDQWQEEYDLADAVVVNSEWSRTLLTRKCGHQSKIHIFPLMYDAPQDRPRVAKTYPKQFTKTRPLKVLFLGQVNVRKGAIELVSAMRQCRDLPVTLSLVGPVESALTALLDDMPDTVEVVGPVSRGETLKHYAAADIMILPTHSDGFALTQLEAQAYGLPLIVSPFCGDVISSGKNGFMLEDVSKEAIVKAVSLCVEQPATLEQMSANALGSIERFSSQALSPRLQSILQGT